MDRTAQRVIAMEQELAILTETVKGLAAYLQTMLTRHNEMVRHIDTQFAATNQNFTEVVNAIGELSEAIGELRDGDGDGEEWKGGHAAE